MPGGGARRGDAAAVPCRRQLHPAEWLLHLRVGGAPRGLRAPRDLVLQDLMFSALDIIRRRWRIRARCEREVEQQLALLQGSPCVLTIRGSAEVEQQGAMSGVPVDGPRHTLFHLAPGPPWRDMCSRTSRTGRRRRGAADLPFRVRTGMLHYFGVGAYGRPLHDARLARRALHDGVPRLRASAGARIAGGEAPRESGGRGPGHAGRRASTRWRRGAGTSRTSAITTYCVPVRRGDANLLASRGPRPLPGVGACAQRDPRSSGLGRSFGLRESPCSGALTWLVGGSVGLGWRRQHDAMGVPRVRGTAFVALRGRWRSRSPTKDSTGVDLHVLNDTFSALEGRLDVRLLRDGR